MCDGGSWGWKERFPFPCCCMPPLPIATVEGLGGLDDCGLGCWAANPNGRWLDFTCLFLEGKGMAPHEILYWCCWLADDTPGE